MLFEPSMKFEHGRKETIAQLRQLADRLEELPIPNAYEAMLWVQPHVAKVLSEGEFILQAENWQLTQGCYSGDACYGGPVVQRRPHSRQHALTSENGIG